MQNKIDHGLRDAHPHRVAVWWGSMAMLLFCPAILRASALPPELTAALANFRADGPKGWSFTQTSASGGERLVEHFDPAAPDFQRWTLVEKNGRPPAAAELQDYYEGKSRRSGGFTAPRIQDRLDPATATFAGREAGSSLWRLRFKPGAADDLTAPFMAVIITFHEPTRTIERIEITSTGPFSPVFAVKIVETATVLVYSRPTETRPSLLESATLHVRGRAFWFKSLDQDMTVTFSAYVRTTKK